MLSLQKGFGSEQLEDCLFRDRFVKCQKEIDSTWDFLENAAIIENKPPSEWTYHNIKIMRHQLKTMGLSIEPVDSITSLHLIYQSLCLGVNSLGFSK